MNNNKSLTCRARCFNCFMGKHEECKDVNECKHCYYTLKETL